MATYTIIGNSTILKPDGGAFPAVDGNRDYEEYKLWVAQGNTPATDLIPAPVVQSPEQVALDATDKDMARVADDVIAVLFSKGIIKVTDLPAEAQALLTARKALKDKKDKKPK